VAACPSRHQARVADGPATLTINSNVLLQPGTLQRDLARDGIPAMVTVGRFCSSDPAPAGFSQVVSVQKIPRADTGSYSCTSAAPAAPPPGGLEFSLSGTGS
jgi:hypothetical protein